VLNASRHHRKNRLLQVMSDEAGTMCSTPRGITGKIARLDVIEDGNMARVLNASRHHRKNRVNVAQKLIYPFTCSTPRGITGKIAKSTP